MKLATFAVSADAGAPTRVGVVVDDLIHPIDDVATMRELIDLGLARALELASHALDADAAHPLSQVTLRAPLVPASVRDFVAFEEHVEGVRKSIDGSAGVPEAWFDAPTFYFTNPHAITGPGDVAAFPAASVARDLELEVAVVVGGRGSSVSPEEAKELVFGYTIMNDWSARDLQRREMQVSLGPAKGKDFCTTLGPWIVTADELESRRDAEGFLDLPCRVTINGEVVGEDVLSNMGWTFESMIAYASRDSLVVPGDVLGSGTTGNGGCLAELWGRRGEPSPAPLKDGDVVTVTVDGIGELTNTVGSGTAPPAAVPVRRRDQAAVRRAHGLTVDNVSDAQD